MEKNPVIDISVIIPLYNEEAVIIELYQRVKESVTLVSSKYELIFINDGSRDKTLEHLINLSKQDEAVKYISLSRNFGHQVAISAGLDYCNGNAVVIIDGDLQDPPELIPDLYNKYKSGYEVVYAKRTARKNESIFKRITAKLFYRLLKRITTIDIPLDTGDYRLIDKKIVTHLKSMPEQNKFFRGQIAWLGFRQTSIEFERDERKAGKTGYPLRKMIRFAIDGITAFSNAPLKFVTNIGIFVSFVAFLIILYAMYSYFILHRTITGWTSLIISTMFIGGVQLISIGIIGEYLSRINDNVKNRPLYIVEETNIGSIKQ